MLQDVLSLAVLQFTPRRPSKETLNHPELIRLASGLDPADILNRMNLIREIGLYYPANWRQL